MQYSPKLKTAMERIKAILKEYDLGAQIIIHTPGFSEYLLKVDPSYSCAKMNDEGIRIKAKLQEDFDGDKEAWTKKVTDTYNLFQHLADVGGPMALSNIKILEMLDKHVEATRIDKGGHSSHTTQNN